MKNRSAWKVFGITFLLSTINFQYFTSPVHAAFVDLALDSNNISFSSSTLYVGDSVRIYARVRNVGDTDATATVLFYQGGMIIGQTQPVSLRANGNPDDVFVDFVVPEGSFNIRAVLQGSTPQDTNPDNDGAITPLYLPVADADRDGILDKDDTCVSDANADQTDTDFDGKGDACDTDDDNDGVLDANDPVPLDRLVTGIAAPVVVAPLKATTPVSSAPLSTVPVAKTAAEVPVASSSPNGSITETAPALANANSTSKLLLSPLARFSWKQIDWRTYEFTLAEQPIDGVRFGWDFGDGATSAQSKITHAFSGPGTYTVTLAIIDADGKSISDAQIFDVSFFHLDNPQVMLLVGLLVAALGAFGFAFFKLRKSYDKGALHE